MRRQVAQQRGFTLVELLVAMAVFGFMLLIVVSGFINIVHLHNQALASNVAQDNARTAMAELVRSVRDSAGVVGAPGAGPSGTLCLSQLGGTLRGYYLNAGVLTRSDNCTTPRINPVAITNDVVQVTNFVATVESSGPEVVKPEIKLTVTLGSRNGTTAGAGAALACNNTNQDRTFCSVVTLTSGAVPR
ncbi:MAG TPA: type II secretion system protein [Candidatus Saccharimonadia bacterium]|nr:type II secretion system protein [Candidatus Saccharimonadia bacterium]